MRLFMRAIEICVRLIHMCASCMRIDIFLCVRNITIRATNNTLRTKEMFETLVLETRSEKRPVTCRTSIHRRFKTASQLSFKKNACQFILVLQNKPQCFVHGWGDAYHFAKLEIADIDRLISNSKRGIQSIVTQSTRPTCKPTRHMSGTSSTSGTSSCCHNT